MICFDRRIVRFSILPPRFWPATELQAIADLINTGGGRRRGLPRDAMGHREQFSQHGEMCRIHFEDLPRKWRYACSGPPQPEGRHRGCDVIGRAPSF